MDSTIHNRISGEIKSTEHTIPVHKKQVITYIRLANKKLGLLLNFGAPKIKEGITRLVNNLEE